MPTQKGGGSVGQSLQYVDPTAKEQTAPAGGDLLGRQGQIVRPEIPVLRGGTRKRGGFIPSIMTGVVNNGVYLVPLVGMTAKRMMNDIRVGKTRKHRKGRKGNSKKVGGGSKDQWKRNQTAARDLLSGPSFVEQYGKPSAVNVNKFAVARRKGPKSAEDWLEEYQARKLAAKTKKASKGKKKAPALAFSESRKVVRAAPAAKKEPKVGQAAWKTLINQAHNRLRKEEGRGTRANAMKFAAMLRKGENTSAFLSGLRARPAAKARTAKSRKASPPARTVNTDPELVALMARQAAEEAAAMKRAANEAAAASAAAKKSTAKKGTAKKATVAAPAAEAAGEKKVTPPYFRELREARTFLSRYGVPRGPNMSEFVKLQRRGESTDAIVSRVQSRVVPGTEAQAKAAAAATAGLKEKMKKAKLSVVREESERASPRAAAGEATATAAAAATATAAAAGRKVTPPYFRELREARTFLTQYGVPRGPNMSEFVKLKRRGESTNAIVSRIQSRAATRTTAKAKAKPKKAGNNNMQGYEENFEPTNE